MADLLRDIIDHLATNTWVQGFGIDSFADYRPDIEITTLALYEYAGAESPPTISSVSRNIQVTVRDKSVDASRQRCWELYKELYTQERQLMLNGTRWVKLTLRQPPFRLSVDAKDRTIWSFNISTVSSPD